MSNPENFEIEKKVIERFIIKSKRERFLTFIQKDKTRIKFIKELSHINFLRDDLFEDVIGNEYEVVKAKISILKNIKDCYIISENNKLDQKRMDIKTALREIIGSDMGSLIVFGDAEIVYSEA